MNSARSWTGSLLTASPVIVRPELVEGRTVEKSTYGVNKS
jgi:hypothetical protein